MISETVGRRRQCAASVDQDLSFAKLVETRANSDLIESQRPSPHCHAGRGCQPESRYPGPDPSLGTGYFADAKFRHDSEHVRAETALAKHNENAGKGQTGGQRPQQR